MQNSQKGISLVITFLIMAIMLSLVLSISSISFNQIKIMSNAGNAISAFYAAESGIERTLYLNSKQLSVGTVRGLCSICSSCNSGNCQACAVISLSEDGSNGCNSQTCNSCAVYYEVSFDDREYAIRAKIQKGVFSIYSKGIYRETSRIINQIGL